MANISALTAACQVGSGEHAWRTWSEDVLGIHHDLSLLAQFLVFGVQELLECEPCLLALLVKEFFAIVGLVSRIRLHISRLAFDHLIDGVPLEELLAADFDWREGWEYTLDAA